MSYKPSPVMVNIDHMEQVYHNLTVAYKQAEPEFGDYEASKAMETLAKKLEHARMVYEVELKFRAENCFINVSQYSFIHPSEKSFVDMSRAGLLFGFYKVTRGPTHYSFVLTRAHKFLHQIGKETILPLHLDMSGPDWSNVTPAKIHTP